MSKATTLTQLTECWYQQKLTVHRRTYSAAGKPPPERWKEICDAHNRRVMRRKKLRNPAMRVASILGEYYLWAAMIRSNRKHVGLPPQVHRFGNSGREKL